MNRFEKARAQQYFDAYPDAAVIYVTSDGQVFLTSNHHDAQNHQRHLTAQDPAARMSEFYKKDLDSPTDEELAEQDAAKELDQNGDNDQDQDEEQEQEEQPAAEQPAAEEPTAVEPAAEEQPAEESQTSDRRSGNKRNR